MNKNEIILFPFFINNDSEIFIPLPTSNTQIGSLFISSIINTMHNS